MSILSILFFILLTTIVQSQNITAQFQTFPVNTDIGTCTCDLTQNQCDISCCCDPNCLVGDLEVFECSSRANIYTNSTPVISSVQPTCFKNLSIFYSNSPYIIQKMGELVCVDFARYQGSQYYQQPVVQTLDPVAFVEDINTDYSVSAPFILPTDLTNYQVGTPILATNTSNNVTNYYSLPINLFNNQLCSGSQTITYMNNFTSTCSQIVNNVTCTAALKPATYINSLCFVQSPSNLTGISNLTCTSTPAPSSNFSGSTCFGALQSLIIRIYYQNPTGIVYMNLTYTTKNVNTTSFEQTFTVQFIQNSLPSSSANATRNPGYLQNANIIVATGNSTTITITDSSQFSISKPLASGVCDGSSLRTDYIPIRFGENIRSTCKYSTSPPNCSGLPTLYIPNNSGNLYVAAYSNPDQTNITTDWLPVIYCASIGSQNYPCTNNILTDPSFSVWCFVKLDIQIAYTNIGSILNPQPVLSAVIFHYQGIPPPSSSPPTNLLIMESVTFQDISDAPIIEQGQIPTPNTRLPANFFYPFTGNQGTKSMTFPSVFYLLITVVFILM